MTPTKFVIDIWRGASFDKELISQVKKYNYDPAVNNTAADLGRTHMENLVKHGFTYEYINFANDYDKAELIVKKAWVKSGQPDTEPLLLLSTVADASGHAALQLTDKSVVIGINPVITKRIDFSSAAYRLLLTKEGTPVAGDTDAGSGSRDQVDCLIYGDFNVHGEK